MQAKQAAFSEWDFLRDVLSLVATTERVNRRALAAKGLVLEALYLVFAAQVILLSAWVLAA